MTAPTRGASRQTRDAERAARTEKVERVLSMLEEGVEQITNSDEFERYLRFSARFHGYSARNCLLIFAQRPGASRVAGYRGWQELGRQVRRGEEGIRILAPVSYAVEDEGSGEKVRALVGFKVASVFDVSQTNGEPLPEAPMPEDPNPDDDPAGVAARVHEGLYRLCEGEGVTVEMADLPPGHYGGYERKGRRIVLNRALGEVERATTLAHELAHHLLHREDDGASTKAVREIEAEGVAFAVFGYFGFDTSRFTFAYIARYAREPEALKAALSRIQKAVHELIEAVEGNPLDDGLGTGGRAS